ncbi:MAG: cytochrome-c peroxidase [Sulfurimonas sp.]|uniref:cytochrome-c peroxidase n=1 Tax=Sulfurimonas sp. TaxID=2022749 RepID=UPI002614DE33|nr:cytochrome-c peroxidase [Sulfurimonas sp.]MDD2652568.1 cytochrome-c peroxidase [Sulfurimonas sp.]MDD3451257.1 cytochrome-c peroxidase [Sulfurimonas sp.]
MKLISIAAIGAISTIAFGATLLEDAKNAGMKPIPKDKKELNKLIDDPKNPMTAAKVELGKKLYFDPRLSKSSLISCNTCHNLGMGGADGVSAAIGHKWTANPHHLNSPTVYNSVLNAVQFWDGRSPHLEDQAQGPIQAGPEMAAPKELVVERVTSIPAYVEEFKKAYGRDVKIDFEKIATTIGVFERTLVTPSRFDEFMNGKDAALSKAEKDGLKTFIDKGCATCHDGIGIGGTMQPFQIANKYKFASTGDFKGDANGMVKAPTLRNIEETAPYFHNGQIWSLQDAIKEMGSVQLGITINDKDAASIETFLKSLTGTKPAITYPILPPSTNTTPKPDAL